MLDMLGLIKFTIQYNAKDKHLLHQGRGLMVKAEDS
jgi:hypothetical protein